MFTGPAADPWADLTINVDPDRGDDPSARVGLLVEQTASQTFIPGLLGDVETEFLHDLRVAVRDGGLESPASGDVMRAGRYRPRMWRLTMVRSSSRNTDRLRVLAGSVACLGIRWISWASIRMVGTPSRRP